MNQLSVLLLREADCWVAQCLEYDIAAQGEDISEVMYQFNRTLLIEIVLCIESGKKPLEGIPTAPQWYWDQFMQRGARLNKLEQIPFRLPPHITDVMDNRFEPADIRVA